MKTINPARLQQRKTHGLSLEEMLLPAQIYFNARQAEQNDFLRKTIVVRNYPASFQASEACVLQKLASQKGITLKMYFKPLSQGEITNLVNTQLQNKKAQKNNNRDSQYIKADIEQANIEKAYADFLNNNEKFYYITIFIEVYAPDKDELKKRVDQVTGLLRAHGMTKDDIIYRQKQAFLSVMPTGENHLKLYARNMPSSTAALMYPCTASSRTDRQGMFLGTTSAGGPMFLDIFQRDDKNANGNISIIGESGQGKSTLMKKIIEMQIARGTSVFTIDPEAEYVDLIGTLGGTSIDCATGNFIINPLELRQLNTPDDISENSGSEPESLKEVNVFKQHLSFLRDFYKVLRPYATEAQLDILIILTQELYHKVQIDEHTAITTLKSNDYPILGDLYEYIKEVFLNFDKYKDTFFMFQKEALRDILLLLKDVYDGSESHLFNGHTNVISSDVIDFNINSLLQGARSRTDAALFNIMTWIWNRVAQRSHQILFAVDELYLLMNRDNLTMARYFRDFAKRARKYEACIATATQNLGDFLDPEIIQMSSVLFNNPNNKFIFYPGDLDFSAVQRLLKLTDGEMHLISEPNRGSCLMKSGGEKHYFHVDLLDYEKDLFGRGGGR